MLFGHNGIACRVFRTRKTLAAQGTGRRDQTDGQTARQSRQQTSGAGRTGRQTHGKGGRANGRMNGQDWRAAGSGRRTSITARPEI